MADLEWLNLRSWNGSQQNAFEEVCCQLAAAEPAPAGSHFVRKGTPDGGIECFWQLPTGDEHGWQAKFVLTPLAAGQWSQLDKSVMTALETHPKLRKYTICIPQNRADARVKDHCSFLDKWNQHVEKWRGSVARGRTPLEFEYWGTSEIGLRLSKHEHAGRRFFWFGTDVLDPLWCRAHWERAIADAGDRYTPNAHVNLPIQELFDAIGFTSEYAEKALLLLTVGRNRLSALIKAIRKLKNRELLSLLKQVIDAAAEFCAEIRVPQNFHGHATRLRALVPRLLEQIGTEQSRARQKFEKKSSRRNDKGASDYVTHCYQRAADSAREIDVFLTSEGARIAGIPALLIRGDAGTGKSHLLCRAASDRIARRQPTILILGEKLRDDEPWAQIAAVAGLRNDNPDEILGALNAAGEASQSRALLLIDALNEGEGKKLWPKNLAGLLHAASSYPWVGVCLSVRSSYEGIVIPSSLRVEKLCRIEHKGFEGTSYEAIKLYCEHYSIDLTSIPLLHPEFSNPLFLKLFCRGLSDRGLRRMPEGIAGLPQVFDFFLTSRNQWLARQENLNYDPKQDFVRQALTALANHFVDIGRSWAAREDARNLVNAVFPMATHDPSLFERLLSEGVLGEEQFLEEETNTFVDGVRFAYERLKEFMIVGSLLDEKPIVQPVLEWYKTGPKLAMAVRAAVAHWDDRGLIQMLAIVLPERFGVEIFEILDEQTNSSIGGSAFLRSLIWRRGETISQVSVDYFMGCLNDPKCLNEAIDMLICLGPRPGHPLNAWRLHNLLVDLPMPRRDAFWSNYLFHEYEQRGGVVRLLDWAWDDNRASEVDSETALLASIILTWCFTSSHRFLRDRSTKAVTCLLRNRLTEAKLLVERFRGINDPYILERVLAAVFGACAQSTQRKGLKKLALSVYSTCFEKGATPVHVLARDYARGIIEVAEKYVGPLSIDHPETLPPFGSEPISSPPTQAELESKFGQAREYAQIWFSVMDGVIGDFATYVIDSMFANRRWSSLLLVDPLPPSQTQIAGQFETSLSPLQRSRFQLLHRLIKYSQLAEIPFDWDKGNFLKLLTKNERKQTIALAVAAFLRTLDSYQRKELAHRELAALLNPNDELPSFDAAMAKRWIFSRVLDLGWTPELFADFDRHSADHGGRDSHKPERVGKKYQWIALHELLARVADRHVFVEDRTQGRPCTYHGAWQLGFVRDIDPTMTLRGLAVHKNQLPNCWWSATHDPSALSGSSDSSWLRTVEDWPSLPSLLRIPDPTESTRRWLAMSSYLTWYDPRARIRRANDEPWRYTWLHFHAYCVRK